MKFCAFSAAKRLKSRRRQVAVGRAAATWALGRVGRQLVKVPRIEPGQHLAGLTRWPSSAWRRTILPATRKPSRDSPGTAGKFSWH